MSKFDPTNYPTVTPVGADLVLIRQDSSGDVKTAKVAALANAATPLTLVETIAELKAVSVDGLSDGANAFISGYFASDDGGGGQFIFSTSSALPDNGGTVIAPDSGSGRWLRVISGNSVNVLQFGAVTSTSAPSAGVMTANVAAMNAAIATGLCVVWPPGNYFINDEVVLGGASVYDFSNFSALLIYVGSGTAVSSTNLDANFIGLYIYRPTPDYSDSSIGLLITGMRFKRPSALVDGFTTGIKIEASNQSNSFFTLNTCYLRTTRCKLGMVLNVLGVGTNSYITSNLFVGFRAGIVSAMAGSYGLVIDSTIGGSDGTIISNAFISPDIEQVETAVYLECNAGSAYGYDFFTPYMEGNTVNFRLPVTGVCYFTLYAGAYFNSSVPVASYGNELNSVDIILRGTETSGILVVGRGGSQANSAQVIMDGSDAAGQGFAITFKRNTVQKGYIASDSFVNGGAANDIVIYSDSDTVKIYANGALAATFPKAGGMTSNGPVVLKSYAVLGLPAAASFEGGMAYVTDANATTRLSIVATGGANKVLVYSDGTNWLIA